MKRSRKIAEVLQNRQWLGVSQQDLCQLHAPQASLKITDEWMYACMRYGQSRDFSRFEERPERGWAVCAFCLSEGGHGKARKGMPESILSWCGQWDSEVLSPEVMGSESGHSIRGQHSRREDRLRVGGRNERPKPSWSFCLMRGRAGRRVGVVYWALLGQLKSGSASLQAQGALPACHKGAGIGLHPRSDSSSLPSPSCFSSPPRHAAAEALLRFPSSPGLLLPPLPSHCTLEVCPQGPTGNGLSGLFITTVGGPWNSELRFYPFSSGCLLIQDPLSHQCCMVQF